MSKIQLVVILSSVLLFTILYLGFDTKPSNRAKIDTQRTQAAKTTDIKTLLNEAGSKVLPTELKKIADTELNLDTASSDAGKAKWLKELSRLWYNSGQYGIAGFYAEQVAKVEQSDSAWSIAGATYHAGMVAAESEKEQQFCTDRAVAAFENAISIVPKQMEHRLNLALVYTIRPPQNNPMKGILMLRNLEEEYPEEPKVFFHLGRLALQTGQMNKAIERLNQAIRLDDNYRNAHCLLAEVYTQTGKVQQSTTHAEKCALLK